MNETLTEKHFENPTAEKKPIIVKFTNFSDEDFTYTWNKIPYTFKAGGVKFMERGIAEHFAKHLINRELLKRGRDSDTSPKKPSENPFFMELYNQCIHEIPSEAGEMDATKAEQEIIDRNMKETLGMNDKAEVPAAPAPESKPKAGKKITKNKKESAEKEEEFEIVEAPAGDSDDE